MSYPEPRAVPASLRDAFADRLHRAFGLSFRPAHHPNLESGLRHAAEILDGDLAALLNRLERGDADAQRVLVSQVTVGETYFFRGAPHFAYLAELLREGGAGRPARWSLWSAGCSTGEEAYSMAIVALEALGPEAAASVDVLGTDINLAALARAREGLYDEWSFRDVSPSVRERWFAREGSRYRVSPRAKALVHFAPQNLLPGGADVSGASPPEPWPCAVDVAFCRNVLLYFDAETVARVGEGLARALALGGALVVGAADPTIDVPALVRRVTPRLVVYVREIPGLARRGEERVAGAPPPPSAAPSPAALRPARPRPARPLRPAPPIERLSRPPPPAPAPAPAPAEGWLAEARRLSDAGDWPAALQALDAGIGEGSTDAAAYRLRALVLQVLHDHARAAADADRAILLAPGSPVAHMLAAVSRGWLGDDAGARRGARNAARLLGGLPGGAPVEDGGGATAGALLATAREVERALASPRRRGRR